MRALKVAPTRAVKAATQEQKRAKGERIRRRRLAANLSIRQLARILELSHVTVAYWERGEHVYEMLATNEAALVTALNTNKEWLNTGRGPTGPAVALTRIEHELLNLERSLGRSGKQALLEHARELATK